MAPCTWYLQRNDAGAYVLNIGPRFDRTLSMVRILHGTRDEVEDLCRRRGWQVAQVNE